MCHLPRVMVQCAEWLRTLVAITAHQTKEFNVGGVCFNLQLEGCHLPWQRKQELAIWSHCVKQ